ncbi:hypothetical protein HGRIS_008405 [Hohenbuehelia grisea]|uniref:Uncharacterized protein n=1 Tax=Hohenbuehelia grisea TaxID=104357 RepID=A0ABR3J8W1_9AGAR
MPLRSIPVTPFIIMHACLTQVCSEVRTLDEIIRSRNITPNAQSPPSNSPHLPVEILLEIRPFLVEAMAPYLVGRSAAALRRHEAEFRGEYCLQCQGENDSTYGFDIWKWNGSWDFRKCLNTSCCRSQKPPLSLTVHPARRPKLRRYGRIEGWLQVYLSDYPRDTGVTFSRRPSFDIWRIVAEVLRDFDCELKSARLDFVPPSLRSPVYNAGGLPRSSSRLEIVARNGHQQQVDDETVLQRVAESLGLSRLAPLEADFFLRTKPSPSRAPSITPESPYSEWFPPTQPILAMRPSVFASLVSYYCLVRQFLSPAISVITFLHSLLLEVLLIPFNLAALILLRSR